VVSAENPRPVSKRNRRSRRKHISVDKNQITFSEKII
jgi:hypothetical protein